MHEYNINIEHRDLDLDSVFWIGAKEETTSRCTLVPFVHLEDKVQTLNRGRDMNRDYGVILEDNFLPEIKTNRRDLKPLLQAANR